MTNLYDGSRELRTTLCCHEPGTFWISQLIRSCLNVKESCSASTFCWQIRSAKKVLFLVDLHPRNQGADGSNILCRFALGARSLYVQQLLDLNAIRPSSSFTWHCLAAILGFSPIDKARLRRSTCLRKQVRLHNSKSLPVCFVLQDRHRLCLRGTGVQQCAATRHVCLEPVPCCVVFPFHEVMPQCHMSVRCMLLATGQRRANMSCV